MPPSQKDNCRFDDAAWKSRVEDTLWRSENSHSNRLSKLEERQETQSRHIHLWLPLIFTAATAGIIAILKLITDSHP